MYFLQKFNAVEKLEIFRKTERNKPKNFYFKIKIPAHMRFCQLKSLKVRTKPCNQFAEKGQKCRD